MPDTPPENLYQAVDWLPACHPWVAQLVRRIVGDTDDRLDEVAGAILDTLDNGEAWERYERQHPQPRDRDDAAAYCRWEEAGPQNADRGSVRCDVRRGGQGGPARRDPANVRGPDPMFQRRVPWTAHDVGGWDERGQAIFVDWLEILRVQGT